MEAAQLTLKLCCPTPQVGFFMPGGALISGASAGSAFAKPAFFNPAAAKVEAALGDDTQPAEPQQGLSTGELPGLRTAPTDEAMAASMDDAKGALHWASSQALLNAEGGTASPPPVQQVCRAQAFRMHLCMTLSVPPCVQRHVTLHLALQPPCGLEQMASACAAAEPAANGPAWGDRWA